MFVGKLGMRTVLDPVKVDIDLIKYIQKFNSNYFKIEGIFNQLV